MNEERGKSENVKVEKENDNVRMCFHTIISKFNFEFLHFLPFHIHHTKKYLPSYSMNDFIAARSQMALSLAFHIIFSCIGMVMPFFMAVSHYYYLKTGKPAFRNIKRRLDYSEYGGAPLLGVSRIVVLGHGRSNARAIRNAIKSVKEFSENRTSERIERGIAETNASQAGTAAFG